MCRVHVFIFTLWHLAHFPLLFKRRETENLGRLNAFFFSISRQTNIQDYFIKSASFCSYNRQKEWINYSLSASHPGLLFSFLLLSPPVQALTYFHADVSWFFFFFINLQIYAARCNKFFLNDCFYLWNWWCRCDQVRYRQRDVKRAMSCQKNVKSGASCRFIGRQRLISKSCLANKKKKKKPQATLPQIIGELWVTNYKKVKVKLNLRCSSCTKLREPGWRFMGLKNEGLTKHTTLLNPAAGYGEKKRKKNMLYGDRLFTRHFWNYFSFLIHTEISLIFQN